MLRLLIRLAMVCGALCLVAVGVALLTGQARASGDFLSFTGWDGERYHIYVLDLHTRLLITLPEDYPPYQNYYGWSEAGNFAFLSDRDGNTEVYLWDWQGMTNISQHPFNDWRPAMSVDGRVAFASERDGNMEIYVWDAGTLTNISQNERTDDYPVWSDDGRLAWVSDRDGDSEIYVWDGERVFNVSRSPQVTDYVPQWGSGSLSWMSQGLPGLSGVRTWDGFQVLQPLPFSVSNVGFAWSAVGGVAYSESNEIFVWNGAESLNVTQNPSSDDYDPVWSSDGRLAFISLRNLPAEVYLWDGQGLQRLTFNDISEDGLAWSP